MPAHVLVVGDDYTVGLRVAEELLQRSYRVTVCTTAERALARIAGGDVDVVLTDGTVPGIRGGGVTPPSWLDQGCVTS